MYIGVPISVDALVSAVLAARTFEMPKSSTLAKSSPWMRDRNTFAGLRSR